LGHLRSHRPYQANRPCRTNEEHYDLDDTIDYQLTTSGQARLHSHPVTLVRTATVRDDQMLKSMVCDLLYSRYRWANGEWNIGELLCSDPESASIWWAKHSKWTPESRGFVTFQSCKLHDISLETARKLLPQSRHETRSM
jgi:hypothetical protein